jgi:2-oxoglutarate ferredoxin oxidoreductase subunit alpha
MRIRMVDKRLKKRTLLEKEAVLPTFYGDAAAGSVILCWGSPKLVVKEAAERLAGEGIAAAVLHFGQVYPLTPEMVAPHRLNDKQRICVENNAGGQFARLLKSELGLAVDHSILKYDGDCFTVDELCQTLRGLLS